MTSLLGNRNYKEAVVSTSCSSDGGNNLIWLAASVRGDYCVLERMMLIWPVI